MWLEIRRLLAAAGSEYMLSFQIICIIGYLCLSAVVLCHSIWLRQHVGQIRFDGQGKQQSFLTIAVFVLGGIYLITSTGLVKYGLFIIAFIVHYVVTHFYVGTRGIKFAHVSTLSIRSVHTVGIVKRMSYLCP